MPLPEGARIKTSRRHAGTAKRKSIEAAHQAAYFEWARNELVQLKYPALRWAHSSLNGVPLPIGLAVKMKKQGMTAGIPDAFVPAARGGFFGLFFEFKEKKNGRMSEEQSEFAIFAQAMGYQCHEVRSWEEASAHTISYLTQESTLSILERLADFTRKAGELLHG